MPSKTAKQQRFFGAEKARREEGKAPRVKGMSDAEVDKMAHKKGEKK